MKMILLILFYSASTLAMVPTIVKNHENLFINQKTPVWCWAAMSEALYGYHHPWDYKTQELIAQENPHALTPNKVEPYVITADRILFPGVYDYMMDTVLSSDKFQSKLEFFNEDKIKSLIDNNQPVMLSWNFHVTMIYGYFTIGEDVFLLVFDPNAWAFNFPSTITIPANTIGSKVWNPYSSVITYLEPRN